MTRSGSGPAVVDVTLRDGGYQNDWAFSSGQVVALARVMARVGVDVVEVGYLCDDPQRALAARCPPWLLEQVRREAPNVSVAGMLRPGLEDAEAVLTARRSLLDLVRIPCELPVLERGLDLARRAHAQGFTVSVNLTSISAYEPVELARAARRVAQSGVAWCLYLADSRGSVYPDELEELLPPVREEFSGPIGFHAHDNLGMALHNSEISLTLGCAMVDGSVNGVGLGGGNTPLGELLRVVRGHTACEGNRGFHELSASLPLRRTRDDERLYALSGAKNLEQEWVPILLDHFARNTVHHLECLPRRRYQSVEEVL